MRLLVRCAAALYPAAWRARYGEELAALAEDAGAGWLDFLDICKGAIKMQILSGGAWRWAAACTLAGLAVAAAIAFRAPEEYRSIAVMRVAQGDLEQTIQSLNRAEQQVLSRGSLAEITQQYDLYPEQRKQEPLESIVERMRNQDIQIRLLNVPPQGAATTGTPFSVAFDYGDRAKAQAVVKDLTGRFSAALTDSTPVELLDGASLPEQPYSPNRASILATGLAVGLGAGLLLLALRMLVRVVPRRIWRFAAIWGFAGLAVAALIAIRMPNRYQSIAVLRLPARAPEAAADRLNQVERTIFSRQSLSRLITTNGLYPTELAGTPLEDVIAKMRNQDVQVRMLQIPGSQKRASAFSISFQYRDREKAQAVVGEFVNLFVSGLRPLAEIEILDPASLPSKPFAPNRAAILGAGIALGIVAGIIFLGIRRWPLVAAVGLAIAILTLPATYLIPNVYRSNAVLRGKSTDAAAAAMKVTSNRQYLQSVIAELGLYPKQPDAVTQMQKDLVVQPIGLPRGSACLVRFDYRDRYKAEAAVRGIVAKIAGQDGAVIEVLDGASLPEAAIGPNRLAIVLTALCVGLIAGAIALSVRRLDHVRWGRRFRLI